MRNILPSQINRTGPSPEKLRLHTIHAENVRISFRAHYENVLRTRSRPFSDSLLRRSSTKNRFLFSRTIITQTLIGVWNSNAYMRGTCTYTYTYTTCMYMYIYASVENAILSLTLVTSRPKSVRFVLSRWPLRDTAPSTPGYVTRDTHTGLRTYYSDEKKETIHKCTACCVYGVPESIATTCNREPFDSNEN